MKKILIHFFFASFWHTWMPQKYQEISDTTFCTMMRTYPAKVPLMVLIARWELLALGTTRRRNTLTNGYFPPRVHERMWLWREQHDHPLELNSALFKIMAASRGFYEPPLSVVFFSPLRCVSLQLCAALVKANRLIWFSRDISKLERKLSVGPQALKE